MSEKIGWNPVIKRKYPSVKKATSKRKAPPKGKGLTFKERLKIATAKMKSKQASMRPKNPTRATIMSQKETQTKKSAWHGIRMGIIESRAKTTMPVSKWVDIPKGIEVTEGGKESEGRDFTGGQKRVTTEEKAKTHWRDYYTNEVISKPEDIEIDHVIPIGKMRKRGVLQSLESQQLFGNYLKNLVITKAETNQNKSAQPLGKFKPPYKPERYARKYHDVLKEFGAVMTRGEEIAYKQETGENPTIATQHAVDWKRGEHVSETQYRHDAAKKRMNARQATRP